MSPLIVLLALFVPPLDAHGDPLPPGAITRFGTLRDRVGSVHSRYSYALSPDGKHLAVEDRHGTALWDVDTGRVVRRFPAEGSKGENPKFGLCYSADGKKLARLAGCAVSVRELKTGNFLFQNDLGEGSKGGAIGFGPGIDQIVVTALEKPEAWVKDATTGKHLLTISFQDTGEALTPAGPFFIVGVENNWHLVEGVTLKTRLQFPRDKDESGPRWEICKVTPDGRRICALSEGGRFRIIDIESGKAETGVVLKEPGDQRGVKLAVAQDGRVAYLVNHSSTVRRWDLKVGKWLDPIPDVLPGDLLLHPDGKRLIVIGENGVLSRYDLPTHRELPAADGYLEEVHAYPSPDGRRVVIQAGKYEKECRLDMADACGRIHWSFRPGEEHVTPRWSPDGKSLAVSAKWQISLREAKTGRPTRIIEHLVGNGRFDSTVFFPPGGDRLVAPIDWGHGLQIIDLKSDRKPRQVSLGGHGQMALSPDGRSLALSAEKYGVQLYDLNTERFTAFGQRPKDGRTPCPLPPAFSPDGSYLITWETEKAREPNGIDRTLAVVRDPRTLAVVREFVTGRSKITAWTFSPNGLWLALGTSRGDVLLWDVETGEYAAEWGGHRDGITSIGFDGPGRLVTGSLDLTALLWHLKPTRPPKSAPWVALTGKDPAEAYRAVWALAADPTAPSYLRTKLLPFAPPTPAKVQSWLADLGADRFQVRESATRALLDRGRLVEPELRAARAVSKSEEVVTRLDGLIAKLPRERTAAEWVQSRAVAAMEIAATAAAKKVLAEWATGAAGARLTIDAKAALRRMEPRP